MANGNDRILGAVGKETLIPIGLVVTLCTVVVGAALWLNTQLLEIDYRLTQIELKIQSSYHDRWRGADMRAWVRMLSAMNPDIEVPKPAQIDHND